MLDCVIYQVAVVFKQVVFSQKMTRTDGKYMVHWGFVFVHCPVCFFSFFPPEGVGDSQVQPVKHTCSSSAPLRFQDWSLPHRRQIFAKRDGKSSSVCNL